MKEQRLEFERNEDPTIVVLDEAKTKKVQENYAKLRMSLSTLFEAYNKGELNEGYKRTLLSVSETYLKDVLNDFGFQGQLAEAEEKRYAQLRRTNEENRELRRLLGEKVTNEDLRERLKNIERLVRAWWKTTGFSYLAEAEFSGHFLKIKLGLNQFTGRGFADDDEVNGRELLQQNGFSFTSDGTREPSVIDNDHNRSLLLELIKTRFPSAQVSKIENHFNNSKVAEDKVFILWGADVYIYNFDELV